MSHCSTFETRPRSPVMPGFPESRHSIALRFYNAGRHHALGKRTPDETYFGMLHMPYAV